MANISGLTALDPRVIATEKFIESKKIPPDQVPQFLMKMGADPRLVGLVSKYQQLQQAAAQQPKGPMPTTTVAQDVNAQAMAMAPQRQQGVAALPAPVMDRAQFAGGGIVGYDDGGFITAPKSNPSNPQNPLDDYRPDPMVQRQIQEQAGLGEMSEADKFRFYGMPMDQLQRPSDSEMFGSALKNMATDPAAIGAGLGGLLGGPIGIPVGGYLGRTIGKVTGMAGGGIVAFAGPDGSLVQSEQLDPQDEMRSILSQYGGVDPFAQMKRALAVAESNKDEAKASVIRQHIKRVSELNSNVWSNRLGNLRRSVADMISPDQRPAAAPRPQAPAEAARPSSAPAGLSSFAGSQFDPVTRAQAGLTAAMTGANRQQPPAGVRMPTAPGVGATSSVDALYDKAIKDAQERKMYERVKDTTTPEEVAELKEKLKKLPEDKKRDAYLALAQAGFTMAQAASQRGATALGALGAGGTEGIKQLASLNKEYKQLDRDLNKEMRSLQRYQTQVENQDRERNFNFEQNKADRIESLRLAKAQTKEQRDQFAESIGLKREGLDIERRAVDTKRDPRAEIERAYWEAIQSGDNVRAKQALDALKQMGEASSSYLSTQLREANRNPFAMGIPGAGGIGGGGQFTVLGSRPAE